MTKKRGKKEKNEEKLKKKMQKDVLFAMCFQNRAISRLASCVSRIAWGSSWWRSDEMLKWVRWVV
jgi:hypothetical protein